MAAVFVLCLRRASTGNEVLLGRKLDGASANQGLTVPAGHYRKKKDKGDRKNAAARELREETGISVSPERLRDFRTKGGHYWFLLTLDDEKPRTSPEFDKRGQAVWGPAGFYPIGCLANLEVARWHRKNLKTAIDTALALLS